MFKSEGIVILVAFALAGCESPSGRQSGVDSGSIKILGLSVATDGSLRIAGEGLQNVSKLRIASGGSPVQLSISSVTGKEINASASSQLRLVAGTAYDLLVTTAQAGEQIVPITVSVPNGSLSPAALSSSGATNGMVLKWDGTSWSPASAALQGPAGPQGPAGAAFGGPNLRLRNGEGSLVGTAVISFRANYNGIHGIATVWDSGSDSYMQYSALSGSAVVGDGGSGSSAPFYFATSDCSGQAYVRPQEVPPFYAAYLGSQLYRAGGVVQSLRPSSVRSSTANCSAISNYGGGVASGFIAVSAIDPVFPSQLTFPFAFERF